MSNRSDSFNRVNGAVVASIPSDAGSAWIHNANVGYPNTWQIVSNQAQCKDYQDQIVLDSGTPNVRVEVKALGAIGGASIHGIILRATDTANYIVCSCTGGQLTIDKAVGGVGTRIAGPTTYTYQIGDVLSASVGADNTIRFAVNSDVKLTATDAAGAASTRHGLRATNSAQPSIYEDFAIYDLALLVAVPQIINTRRDL